MAAGTQSHAGSTSESERGENPDIFVCESAPGKAVFLESGNTEGWIASELTVDIVR